MSAVSRGSHLDRLLVIVHHCRVPRFRTPIRGTACLTRPRVVAKPTKIGYRLGSNAPDSIPSARIAHTG